MINYPNQNESEFYERIVKVFGKYKVQKDKVDILEDYCEGRRKIVSRTYQKFVSDYISIRTPYRGLLVYHGLGSGKTRTAVQTMNSVRKDVVIMLPASLRGNFERTVKRLYRGGKRYTFVSYNASNLLKQYAKIEPDHAFDKTINNFDGKLVIIDESHIFFQNVVSGKATQAIKIFKWMIKSRKSKFLFLTGTPIAGDPFELVPMFNVLRGYELFPGDRHIFNKHFISYEHNSVKNVEIFKERLSGLVSYYRGMKDPNQFVVPANLGTKMVTAPMGSSQWASYMKVRKREADIERIFKYKTEAFVEARYKKPQRASVGTYKINSAMACNFTFPQKIEKIFNAIVDSLPSKKGIIDWGAVKKKFPKVSEVTFPRKMEVAEIKWRLMVNFPEEVKKVVNNLQEYSGKIKKLVDNLVKDKKKKKFVFSNFKVLGVRAVGFVLESMGFKRIYDKSDYGKAQPFKGFAIIDGDTKNKEELKDLYNLDDNVHGEKINILLGTKVVSAGVNFKHVRETHILEPQWRDITVEQVIGRAIRICSHRLLPRKERNVQIYIYISTPGQGGILPKDDKGRTTDEMLYRLANTKSEFIGTFLKAIKESAVDCNLNAVFNEPELNCMTCKVPGIKIFPRDYKEHIISGPRCSTVESNVKLYPIPKKYLIINPKIKKMKIDINETLFDLVDGTWTEVGFVRDGEPILYDTEL